jgi:hypothetical protein
MNPNATAHPAALVAELLNSGVDVFAALAEAGIDEESVMPEHACLPLGDVDCDVIDFCDGTLLRRPERAKNSTGEGRRWTLGTYERA